MNILHYSLGFPPYRSGGMTKYCLDLVVEQKKNNHNVGVIWPGTLISESEKCWVVQRKKYLLGAGMVCNSYEILNSLPVSLMDGIVDVDFFIQKKNQQIFEAFLKKEQIEVIHFHTVMGLPKEFVLAAKKLNIKTIYTTHDYFGICPKWGLVNHGAMCENDHNCEDCIDCNLTALSRKKLYLIQSPLYRLLKNTKIVSKLRKRHNDILYLQDNEMSCNRNELMADKSKYLRLRQYYLGLLSEIQCIHFNSHNTKEIFDKYVQFNNSVVLSISNASIKENVITIKEIGDKLKIGYLGPITKHKGFFYLLDALKEIYQYRNSEFELHIYVQLETKCEFIVTHNPYTYEELETVFSNIDILIVPSQWYETFGFTVPEALSFGVPVIVSENVGAKDLIENGKSGYVFSSKENLREILNLLFENPLLILEMKKYIKNNVSIKTMFEHNKEIEILYLEG